MIMQRGIEVGFGPTLPTDTLPSVPYLLLDTPVRILSTRDIYGRVVGVLFDNGRRGTVRDGVYRSGRYVQDITPNVMCYLVEEDDTGREFECHPSKVAAA
jgi:hypothetical protein